MFPLLSEDRARCPITVCICLPPQMFAVPSENHRHALHSQCLPQIGLRAAVPPRGSPAGRRAFVLQRSQRVEIVQPVYLAVSVVQMRAIIVQGFATIAVAVAACGGGTAMYAAAGELAWSLRAPPSCGCVTYAVVLLEDHRPHTMHLCNIITFDEARYYQAQ